MRHDLTMRLVRPDDIEVLVELIRRNFDELIAKYHSPGVVAKFRGNATREKIAEWMESKEIYVVEANRELVATGALACFRVADGERHHISQFFVRADLHRQGIGSTLLLHLIQMARNKGIRELHVPSSRNAIPFYQRAGFATNPNQAESSDEITWMTMEI
jgi:N-acetylglutamate synthase-like GNAT family acetyltransferase